MIEQRPHRILVAAALALLVAAQCAAQAAGSQNPASILDRDVPPAGPTPHTSDGKVDLSGVWNPGSSFMLIGQPPFQPWAEALYKERRANLAKDDPESRCLPSGVPRIAPFPYKIIQTPNLIVMLQEGNVHTYRQFFFDREHPKDLEPTWMGDSIARWDGDTLVVDTVGLNDKTWLNGQGAPHTDALHVVERYRRPDLGHLEVEITLDDPKALTRPYTFKRTHILLTNWEIHEYICNEFNVDAEHLVGR